jgi:hypothetical protein
MILDPDPETAGNNNNFLLLFRSELGDSFSLCPRQENDTDAKIIREKIRPVFLAFYLFIKL